MIQKLRKSSAFTLIELLVVVIIVAVLAAVGVPMLSASVARARASEAEAGLGSIRTALRAHFAEVGPAVGYSDINAPVNPITADIGLGDGDLDGRFFSDETFSIDTAGAATYCIEVNGESSNSAPRADQVADPDGAGTQTAILRSMNEDGTICNNLCPCATPAPAS